MRLIVPSDRRGTEAQVCKQLDRLVETQHVLVDLLAGVPDDIAFATLRRKARCFLGMARRIVEPRLDGRSEPRPSFVGRRLRWRSTIAMSSTIVGSDQATSISALGAGGRSRSRGLLRGSRIPPRRPNSPCRRTRLDTQDQAVLERRLVKMGEARRHVEADVVPEPAESDLVVPPMASRGDRGAEITDGVDVGHRGCRGVKPPTASAVRRSGASRVHPAEGGRVTVHAHAIVHIEHRACVLAPGRQRSEQPTPCVSGHVRVVEPIVARSECMRRQCSVHFAFAHARWRSCRLLFARESGRLVARFELGAADRPKRQPGVIRVRRGCPPRMTTQPRLDMAPGHSTMAEFTYGPIEKLDTQIDQIALRVCAPAAT